MAGPIGSPDRHRTTLDFGLKIFLVLLSAHRNLAHSLSRFLPSQRHPTLATSPSRIRQWHPHLSRARTRDGVWPPPCRSAALPLAHCRAVARPPRRRRRRAAVPPCRTPSRADAQRAHHAARRHDHAGQPRSAPAPLRCRPAVDPPWRRLPRPLPCAVNQFSS